MGVSMTRGCELVVSLGTGLTGVFLIRVHPSIANNTRHVVRRPDRWLKALPATPVAVEWKKVLRDSSLISASFPFRSFYFDEVMIAHCSKSRASRNASSVGVTRTQVSVLNLGSIT